MRKLCGFMAVGFLLALAAENAPAQPPGGGGRGGPGGRGGGFGGQPGGGWQGGPGGGRPGGNWQGGGDRGGRGGRGGERGEPRAFDSDRFFEMIARGNDVIVVSELDERRKAMLERMGLSGNRITRDQFTKSMEKMRQQFGIRGGGGDSNRGGDRGRDRRGRDDDDDDRGEREREMNERADSFFRRSDRNGDGTLDADEMSETLRDQRREWDKNRDGRIDREEYTGYLTRYYEERQERRDRGRGESTPVVEFQRPDVYYYGNLPEDIPDWFSEFDTDRDGQVGLYEWRAADKDIAEFEAMDANLDGLLTPNEMLAFQQAQEAAEEEGNGGSRNRRERDRRERDRDDDDDNDNRDERRRRG